MERQPEPEYMDLAEEAEAYALADFGEVNRAFAARVLEVGGSVEVCRALDLGTGPGEIPLLVAAERSGWRITAVDASEAMLASARRSAAEQGCRSVRWVGCDAKRLGLAADAFDVVFSNSILHHLTDTDAFWSELRRVARVGALVVLRDLFRPVDARAARALVAKYAGGESRLLQEEFYRSFLSAYTVEEVREQLVRAGLDGLEVRQVTDRHLDVTGRVG